MLPSTGYFKGIPCPYYENGLCERPYCHYKHWKRESVDAGSSTLSNQPIINQETIPQESPGTSNSAGSEVLTKLFSDAVKKVFEEKSELLSKSIPLLTENTVAETIVSEVLERLKSPEKEINSVPVPMAPAPRVKAYLPPSGIPLYKPTPISELKEMKKRHIPVPYTPASPSGSKVQLKRPRRTDDVNKKRKQRKGSSGMKFEQDLSDAEEDKHEQDTSDVGYNPEPEFLPRTLPYSPPFSSSHNGLCDSSKTPSYVPSAVNSLTLTSNNYEPFPVSTSTPMPEYCPTDKGSSNIEPDYVPESSNDKEAQVEYTPSKMSDDFQDLQEELNLLDDIHFSDDDDMSDDMDRLLDTSAETSVSDEKSVESKTEDVKIETEKEVNESRRHSNSSSSKNKDKKHDHSKLTKHSGKVREHSEKKYKDHKREDKRSSPSKSERRKSTEKISSNEKSDKTKRRESKDDAKTSSSHKTKVSSKGHSRDEKKSSRYKSSKSHSKSKSHSNSRSNSSKSKRSSEEERRHHHHRRKSSSSEKRHSSSSSSSKSHTKDSSKHTSSHSKMPAEVIEMESDASASPPAVPDVTSDVEFSDNGISLAINEEVPSSDSESRGDSVEEECYRIFQEYTPQQSEDSVSQKVTKFDEPVVEEEEFHGKQRVAHEGAQKYPPIKSAPRKTRPSPAEIMSQRLSQIREAHKKASEAALPSTSAGASNSIGAGAMAIMSGRVRIAHVPNVASMLGAKSRIQEEIERRRQLRVLVQRKMSLSSALPIESAEPRTVVQTVRKGGQRLAHQPSATVLEKPVVQHVGPGKVPLQKRQECLDHLVKEYQKIYPVREEANSKAVEEEARIYNRSGTQQVYYSQLASSVSRVRKIFGQSQASTSRPAGPLNARVVSHSAILAGHSGTKGTWSIEKPKSQGKSEPFYHQLLPYVLTEELLCENGFPRPNPEEPGVPIIHLPTGGIKKAPEISEKFSYRVCCRCKMQYAVNHRGEQLKNEQCVYHWGRMLPTFVGRVREMKYRCCSGQSDSVGCVIGPCHTCDSGYNPDELKNFMTTLPCTDSPRDGDYGVYALDCEMCYTTMGLELTRVTVIDEKNCTAYESLVKPDNPIIDYNTRFSGISEGDLDHVKTRLFDVQARLLTIFNDKTILIGHSLESDMKALKLIHSMVVDTSVVFPHKMGPPKKRALKNLTMELLKKAIQNSEFGHDSREDAVACMDLMQWKVKHP